MRNAAIAVAVTALVAALLGATVFREQVARAADKAQSVFVTNDAAQPASVTSTDDPGRQAFAFFQNDSFGSPEDSHSVAFTVPAGKRLVIESVSINAALETGTGRLVLTAVQADVNGRFEDYIMAPTFSGTAAGNDLYTASEATTIYADGGSEVRVFATNRLLGGGV